MWSTISLGFLPVTRSAFPTGITGESRGTFYLNPSIKTPKAGPQERRSVYGSKGAPQDASPEKRDWGDTTELQSPKLQGGVRVPVQVSFEQH